MANVIVDFTCKEQAYRQAQRESIRCNIYHRHGIAGESIEEGTVILRFLNVDEVIFESMTGKELLEWLGIDSEYYINHEEVVI